MPSRPASMRQAMTTLVPMYTSFDRPGANQKRRPQRALKAGQAAEEAAQAHRPEEAVGWETRSP